MESVRWEAPHTTECWCDNFSCNCLFCSNDCGYYSCMEGGCGQHWCSIDNYDPTCKSANGVCDQGGYHATSRKCCKLCSCYYCGDPRYACYEDCRAENCRGNGKCYPDLSSLLGLSPDFIKAREVAQKVFDSVDLDGNGVITKGEAADFLFRTGRIPHPVLAIIKMDMLFAKRDANSNGLLEPAEFDPMLDPKNPGIIM